jgi:hypothetical protein
MAIHEHVRMTQTGRRRAPWAAHARGRLRRLVTSTPAAMLDAALPGYA